MARMVVEHENGLIVLKLVGLRKLGLELAEELQELRPFSFCSKFNVVETIPCTERQAYSAIYCRVVPFCGPGMEVGITSSRPAPLHGGERVATERVSTRME